MNPLGDAMKLDEVGTLAEQFLFLAEIANFAVENDAIELGQGDSERLQLINNYIEWCKHDQNKS